MVIGNSLLVIETIRGVRNDNLKTDNFFVLFPAAEKHVVLCNCLNIGLKL